MVRCSFKSSFRRPVSRPATINKHITEHHLTTMNLNHVQLAGRLTRDPEIRYTPAGVAITDIGIAVNRFSKDDQGETKESTDFIDVTAFGKTAEIIQEHLHKGSPVYVEGRLKLDQW